MQHTFRVLIPAKKLHFDEAFFESFRKDHKDISLIASLCHDCYLGKS